MLSGTRLRPEALKTYYQWIHKQVADDAPWDQFVRAIVTATGESVRERPHQLLRPQPVARRHDRKRQPGVPRAVDRLRQVPQPPARKMDERPVLQHGQPVRPGAGPRAGAARAARATAGERSTSPSRASWSSRGRENRSRRLRSTAGRSPSTTRPTAASPSLTG